MKDDDDKHDSDNNTTRSSENSMSLEERDKTFSFYTSTPMSTNCENCLNRSECVDCIVKHVLGRHGDARKLMFSNWP